jgi:hypothetical protein
MSETQLFLDGKSFKVKKFHLMDNCDLFKRNVSLLDSGYRVCSEVSLLSFGDFVSALEGRSITIPNENHEDLRSLCEEFRFEGLTSQLLNF